jgi:hypothetical protein
MAGLQVPIIVVFTYASKDLSVTHEPTLELTRLVLRMGWGNKKGGEGVEGGCVITWVLGLVGMGP